MITSLERTRSIVREQSIFPKDPQVRESVTINQLFGGIISPLHKAIGEAQNHVRRLERLHYPEVTGHLINGTNGNHQASDNPLELPHHQVAQEAPVYSPRFTAAINPAGETSNIDQVATKPPSHYQAETIYPLINLLNEINQRARFKREDISKSANERAAQLDEAQAWVEQIEKEYKDERGHFTNKSVGREIKNMKRRIKYQRGKIKPGSTSKNVSTEEVQPVTNSQVDSSMADEVKEITNKAPSLDQVQRVGILRNLGHRGPSGVIRADSPVLRYSSKWHRVQRALRNGGIEVVPYQRQDGISGSRLLLLPPQDTDGMVLVEQRSGVIDHKDTQMAVANIVEIESKKPPILLGLPRRILDLLKIPAAALFH